MGVIGRRRKVGKGRKDGRGEGWKEGGMAGRREEREERRYKKNKSEEDILSYLGNSKTDQAHTLESRRKFCLTIPNRVKLSEKL